MQWIDEKFVGADFETDGVLQEYALQPWRRKEGEKVWWPTSFVGARKMSNPDRIEYYVDKTMPTVMELKRFLKDAIELDLTIVGWNLLYDIQCFLALGDDFRPLVQKAKWLDGMLLWKHYFIEPEYDMNRNNKKSYRLKDCVREILPAFANYEEGIVYHNPTPEELVELHTYNRRDTVLSLRLTKYFYNRLEPQQLKAALIEAASLPYVAIANFEGQNVCQLTARELGTDLTRTAARLLAELAPQGVTEKVVRSPVQMGKLLFEQWKLPVLKLNKSKKTGKETRSTDKEVLHELAFIDPRAKKLRDFREALNNKAKYVDTPLKSVEYNGDGKTHPQAIIFGTYTGRMTYASSQGKGKELRQTGWALHQSKREKRFRMSFTAPEGYDIVEFDAAGQEFRWMACASGDEVMMQLCMPGEDPHSYMGAKIENKDYKKMLAAVAAKEEWAAGPQGARMMGKVGNLSLQYRTSAKKLRSVARVQYLIPMELPQAQIIHRTYQNTYRKVPIYWSDQIIMTRKIGYVETFGGRRVHVTGNWDGSFGWQMGSTAINYRIQGTGADQKYLAIACLRNIINQYDIKFGWDFHDGLYWMVPCRYTEKFRVEAKKILDNLPYKRAWGYVPPIPMPWDCKVGKTWGSLKEVH